MASPEAERFAEMLRQAPRMVDMTLADQRAAGEHAEDLAVAPEGVRYEQLADAATPGTGRVRGLWAIPPGAPADRAILYLFGGGHVITSVNARRKFGGHLALAAGVRVLLLDYPLAPEHPYPADVDAATAGYRLLLGSGFPASGVALAGESSGGGLVLSTLLALAEAGVERPAAAYLMSPWADLTCSGASFDSRRDVDLECTRESLLRMAGQYLDGHDAADPAVSPALADPAALAAALPPLLVQVGSEEVLLDDSVATVRSAGIAGVRAVLDIWPGMQHFFQVGVGVYPEAGRALGEAGAWLARHLLPEPAPDR